MRQPSLTLIISALSISIIILLLACGSTPEEIVVETAPMDKKSVRYLALGDSYTIGHDVPQEGSFPFQLKDSLIADSTYTFDQIKIIAKTGWTCEELSAQIDTIQLKNENYNLVTLLIGVNDQYRKYPISAYPQRFLSLAEWAITIAGDKKNVLLLSIPDYGVTPFGKQRNGLEISAQIDQYNSINKSIADSLGLAYFNITSISRKAENDLSYLAPDKLHPSQKMYSEWVSLMLPYIKTIMK